MNEGEKTTVVPESRIAIVGMAGRFPGAPDIETLWRNLAAGITSIRPLADDELRDARVDSRLLADPQYIKVGAPIDDVDCFDARFFGFTDREAEVMDPQHRLFLECAWEALESAGYTPRTFPGVISVFAGSAFPTYLQNNLATHPDLIRRIGRLQIAAGHDRASLASKVSHKLDLRGPCISVQTACSTSLVAVHLACQSLLTYESDLALAGAVSINFPQGAGYLYEPGGNLSADGICRALDARAQGTVLGNGLAIVILKRLTDALADHDHIHAVIRGSCVNNDGSARAAFSTPSAEGQTEVIAEALAHAGVSPESIGYVEMHATGNALSDSIELTALSRAFRLPVDGKRSCAIGSLKPNIGHLEDASGVAGLVKTALCLEHKTLLPTLNVSVPNSSVAPEGPFYVNTTLSPWPSDGTPRIAGVSSFGMGGTNAHIILEEAPVRRSSTPSVTPQVLLLSAKSALALDRMRHQLSAFLERQPDLSPADVAFTLQLGRMHFDHRAALVFRTIEEAVAGLAEGQNALMAAHPPQPHKLVNLIFSHCEEQPPGAVQGLCELDPRVRDDVHACLESLDPPLSQTVQSAVETSILDSASAYAQAERRVRDLAVFVIQYAVGKLLLRLGVRPGVITGGDRIGDSVAACLTDRLSLSAAIEHVVAEMVISDASLQGERVREDSNDEIVLVRLDTPNDTNAASIVGTLARLWLAGLSIDWSALHRARETWRVALPTYPFDRRHFWIEPA
jgi:acyl transferase domain-containing protein